MVIREDQDEQLSGEKQRGVECQTGAPCPARRSLALAKQEAQCAATAPQITANRRSPAREPGLPLHALRANVGASAGCVLLRVPPAAQSCVPCAALLLHSARSPHPPAQQKSRACCLTRTGLTLSSAATAELRPGARAVRGGKWCELHSLAISPPKSRAPGTACSRTFTFTLLLLCPGLAPSLCLPVHSARFVPSHHHHACSRRWWHGRSVDLRQAQDGRHDGRLRRPHHRLHFRSYQHHSLRSRSQWYAEDPRPIHAGLRSNLRLLHVHWYHHPHRQRTSSRRSLRSCPQAACHPSALHSGPTRNHRQACLSDFYALHQDKFGAHLWGVNCTILWVTALAVCTYLPSLYPRLIAMEHRAFSAVTRSL